MVSRIKQGDIGTVLWLPFGNLKSAPDITLRSRHKKYCQSVSFVFPISVVLIGIFNMIIVPDARLLINCVLINCKIVHLQSSKRSDPQDHDRRNDKEFTVTGTSFIKRDGQKKIPTAEGGDQNLRSGSYLPSVIFNKSLHHIIPY